MINSVSGKVTYVGDSEIYLETEPFELSIFMADPASQHIAVDMFLKVYTFLNHKEDRMELYGFKDVKDRELFFQLIKVQGFGPKQAMKVLGNTSAENFVALLESGDADALATLPGIGKKTASKIILALKGKLSIASEGKAKKVEHYDEITEALAGMGFDKKAAHEVVVSLRSDLAPHFGGEDLEREIFRQAIVNLNGK